MGNLEQLRAEQRKNEQELRQLENRQKNRRTGKAHLPSFGRQGRKCTALPLVPVRSRH